MRRDVAVPAHNAVRRSANNLAVLRFRFCVANNRRLVERAWQALFPSASPPTSLQPGSTVRTLKAGSWSTPSDWASNESCFRVIPADPQASFVSHVGYSLMIAAFSAEVVNRRLLFG